MTKPLVSILIPAYNAQAWIAESIKSAIAQTWKRKEIIVVDDGSTDQTLTIASGFASQGVKVITQPNQGAAAARNMAFSVSRGDYIQWLDADDLLAPDKIARQMHALQRCESKRTLASSAWAPFAYRYYNAEFAPSALWCDLSPREWLLRKMERNLHMQTATWLVSREITQAAGPWDTSLLGDDDGEYFCRVLLQSDGVRFVSDAKVFYRMAGCTSLSYIGHSSRKMEAQFRSMQLHIGYLRSLEDSERVRAVCVKYLQNWLISFYPERLDIVKEAQRLAADLGGTLRTPSVSWKYAWIRALFGWGPAKRAQVLLPRIRWSLVRAWDNALFHAHNRFRLTYRTQM
jgi:glycosyltransferase involved in cell wall biosynthesis